MKNAVDIMRKYIEKNIPNQKIDYKIFSFTIYVFIYAITIERYEGRTHINYEEALENFIKNSMQCINLPKE